MKHMFSFDFGFWFAFRSTFHSPISPEIHLFYLDWTLCPYETCMLGSLGKSVVIHRIGHNSMMKMFSFNFWFWFGFNSSFPSRISPEIQLLYSDWTLCPYETCMLGSLGSSVVIHRIGHNSMMHMFSFDFGFWFGFRSTFPSPISPEIHLFYSDWTLCPYETCMLGSLGSSVVIH